MVVGTQLGASSAFPRRATYAAEEAAQRAEKEKRSQDLLIDRLQQTLKQHNQQIALYKAQIVAQQQETVAAKQMLMEAEREMEAILFETRQITHQYESTVTAIAKRDEALTAVREAIRHQGEEELTMMTELEGFKREIRIEQGKNEQLTAVLRKVESEQPVASPLLLPLPYARPMPPSHLPR